MAGRWSDLGIRGIQKLCDRGRIFWINTVFPKRCFGCGAWDTFLCDSCEGKMPVHMLDVCLLCQGKGGQGGRICPRCARRSALDGLIAASYFHGGVTQKLVHHMKFGGGYDIARLHCAPAIISCLRRADAAWIMQSVQALVPVPLHPYRRVERGYNQALAMSECVSLEIGIPTQDCMQKIKNTHPQARKTRSQRMELSHDAYSVAFPPHEVPQSVLLIDDVCTTGSTLEACARALKKSGVAKVYGVVFARD